jgi:cyanate permease
MRVVAALTEEHGRGTGSRAGWLLILSQIACRNGAIIVPIITTRNKEEHSMMDVIVLGLAFGFLRSRSATPTSANGFEENGS